MVKLSTLDGWALNAGRNLFSSLIILAYLRRPHFTGSLPQIGGGIASLTAMLTFVIATQKTSAANAILLQYTSPIFIALFGIWYLNERPKPIDWWTIMLVLIGMALFFVDSISLEAQIGNLYAVLAGVSLAWMVLFLRKQKDGSPAETSLLGCLLSLLVGLPALLNAHATVRDWTIMAYLGIFQLGIPFVIYSNVIKRLEATEASLIQTLEPILNPIWVLLFIGEMPTPTALAGGFLVLLAVTVRAAWSSIHIGRRYLRTDERQLFSKRKREKKELERAKESY
jgi:drug/metabolite transporter (DMT)-like permease